jgi:hypothetical protein
MRGATTLSWREKPLQISPLEPIRLPRVIKVNAEERVNSEQHWEFL